MAFADLKRSAQHDVGLITAALTGPAVALSWLPLVAEIPLMVPIVFLGLGLTAVVVTLVRKGYRPAVGHLTTVQFGFLVAFWICLTLTGLRWIALAGMPLESGPQQGGSGVLFHLLLLSVAGIYAFVPIAVVLIALLLWGLRGAADRRAAAELRPTAGPLSGWAHRVDR